MTPSGRPCGPLNTTNTMRMKIHPITGKNRYCGPAAISAITGCTTDDAAYAIRKNSGQRFVKGTYAHQVIDVLKEAGITCTQIRWSFSKDDRMTLAQWLRHTVDKRKPGIVYLLVAGNHYQVVSGRRATCGRIRKIVSVTDKSLKRRSRVSMVWQLSTDGITPPKKPKRTSNLVANLVRKRAQEHGIEIQIDRGVDGQRTFYYVYGPDHIEEHPNNPLEFSHIAYSWEEALTMVNEVIEFKEGIENPGSLLITDGGYTLKPEELEAYINREWLAHREVRVSAVTADGVDPEPTAAVWQDDEGVWQYLL